MYVNEVNEIWSLQLYILCVIFLL